MNNFPVVSTPVRKFSIAERALTTLVLASAAGAASAAPIDVTAVVSDIAGTSAPIAAIGSAVLVILVGIFAFKWVRRAF